MSGNAGMEKKVVLSFLNFIQESGKLEADQVDVVQSVLHSAFAISPEEATEGSNVNLVDIWPKEASENQFEGEKWNEFIEVLSGKGYFKGCEEGSDEYKARTERAKAKFAARSNPYEGLTPDQLKSKGNEMMTKGQHKTAVGYYSKAIEMEPDQAVFYCNRAAAYTHLNQFKEAVRDCEKATQLRPDYSKAYSRLGLAHFYLNDFGPAVVAFKEACQLEPENETYQKDLAAAESKKATAVGGPPAGFDMNAIGSMMANPQFQQMAQNVMQNPAFTQLVSNMAENMGTGEGGMPDMSKMAQMWGGGGMEGLPGMEAAAAGAEGSDTIPTPFGPLSKDKLARLHEDQDIKNNPKFAQLSEDLKNEGPMAIMKHMNDPEVMEAIGNFSKLFSKDGEQQ